MTTERPPSRLRAYVCGDDSVLSTLRDGFASALTVASIVWLGVSLGMGRAW